MLSTPVSESFANEGVVSRTITPLDWERGDGMSEWHFVVGYGLETVMQNLQLASTNAATYIRNKMAAGRQMSAEVSHPCRLWEDAAEEGRAQWSR